MTQKTRIQAQKGGLSPGKQSRDGHGTVRPRATEADGGTQTTAAWEAWAGSWVICP